MPDAETSLDDQETIEIETPDLTPDPEGGEMELVMEDPFNPSEINIISKVDTLRNLIERLKFDEIDMNPDFQRHAELWDNPKMARLIESILIRFPLPALFTKAFQYLSADRISPKAAYEASDYYIKDLNSIGNHGEYTAHYIAENGLRPLSIKALKYRNAPSLSLLDNLDKWMAEISPGIRIKARLHPAINSVSLSYAFEQGAELTAEFKPENVGFGLTFVLPVLVSILRAEPGDMLIIENPEAHLHPGGQSALGRLCAIAADAGVQLFIETHSDHFLNGIRVAIKEGVITNTEVKLFYLERNDTSVHESLVVTPQINKKGRIDIWPKGFFDEADIQLEKLL